MKPVKFLILALVRAVTILIIFAYSLFAIVFISVPVSYNLAECDRLEKNYVTCQQYETSIDMTVWAISNLFSFPIDVSNSRFSYQLKGAEIYDGILYLETDREPILYKHRSKNSQTLKHSSAEVENFILGTGAGKLTLFLENLALASATYLFACLSIGALIIGFVYYLDKSVLAKLFQLN